MPAQIRPNRLDVTDRFPMLGFTIRTDGSPQRAEVVLAASPELFRPEHKAERTSANFYSSRSGGPVLIQRGEAQYLVPAEVLARFIGQERIYFGLATMPDSNGTAPRIEVLPDAGSPYIQLRGLTSRSLRRVRLVPNRQERAAGYGTNGHASLEWAGDKAAPATNGSAANGTGKNGTGKNGTAATAPAPSIDEYNDGFGPLDPPSSRTSAGNGAMNGAAKVNGNGHSLVSPPTFSGSATPVAAAGYQPPFARVRPLDASTMSIGGVRVPVEAPEVTRLSSAESILVDGALMALPPPFGPTVTALRLAARTAGVSIGVGPSVSGGLGAGVGLGYGVVFGPDGGVGAYGSAEFEAGFLASISLTAQVTVVNGGIESFNGWGLAAAVSGGEGIVGGAAALFDLNGNFQGVSMQVGIGAGLTPIDFYVAVQRSVAVQLAQVQSRAMAARAFADAAMTDDSAHGIDEPIPDGTVPETATAQVYGRGLSESPEDPYSNRFDPAARTNYRQSKGTRAIKRIVIHITDGQAKTKNTVRWFQMTNQTNAHGKPITVSAHYVIGQDGEIVQMVRHNDVAWHGGNANADSIGIEHVANKRGLNPTEPQYQASAALVRHLCDTYGIPLDRDHILGHKEADPKTTHDCPSRIWNWEHYLDLVCNGPETAEATPAAPQSWTRGLSAADRAQSIDEPIPDGVPAAAASAFRHDTALGETPDYPAASRFEPAASNNYRHVADVRQIDRIVIHITDGGAKIGGTIAWFQNPNQTNSKGQPITVSAHYVIGQDGEVVQMVHHNDVAWHAGRANGDSIGIEHVANKRGLNPTEAEYCASAALVRFLCDSYSIPLDRDHILGHREADPSTSHDCPSGMWNWDHFMNLVRNQVCEPLPALPKAQSYRSQRVKPLGEESFSINWDEVEAIPQPSDFSCWAAAAAMVVGWKELVSLAPETIATICNRTTAKGLNPAEIQQFANEIGLVVEPPQCYTLDGFRTLLENYGPLWVAASVPGLHAIVVTGLYSDGTKTYVRVTDPWDRTVGVPGAPGSYQSTHVTGSRYILTWEDFVKEYESAATDYTGVNLQILHADNAAGREINRGSATKAGYAQSVRARTLSARPLGGESYSVNWDEVESIPQPTDMGCWATAAAMVVGWRDQICLTPDTIAQTCGRAAEMETGLSIRDVGKFGKELGLVAENPECYTAEGFRTVLENNGPLWVGIPGHAIVVTGLYSDGTNTYVRVTDPWDRTAGTPGTPGPYLSTHATGSRYILGWEDFTKEYELAGSHPAATLQILHSGSTAGRTPNYGSAKGAGYAQQLRLAKAQALTGRTRLFSDTYAPSPAATQPVSGRRRVTGSAGAARWVLDQYDGLRYPKGADLNGGGLGSTSAIALDEWPAIRLSDGDVKLPISISWRHAAGAVGDVEIRAGEPRLVSGWSIVTTADITEVPDAGANAVLAVRVCQVFSQAGKADITACTDLALHGDGTYQRQDNWATAA